MMSTKTTPKKASNKRILIAITSGVVAAATASFAGAAGSATTKAPPKQNKFDFYILATQWIPGWCEIGTGQSGAELDLIKACQQQASQPLMFHGLWPENNDGSYPSNCSDVPLLDKTKLTFANPFVSYLSNANSFLNHEWSKHGTCSTHYTQNEESSNSEAYYRGVNHYFEGALAQYRQIKLPTFMLQITTTELQHQVHERNPHIPLSSIMVMCDGNSQDERYLTGLWFCSDKANNKFIPCPAAVTKNACSGTILTR